jgi:uncharacterized integral membrane protein
MILPDNKEPLMKSFRFGVYIVSITLILALLLIAILQNMNLASVKFLVFGMNAPVIVIILVSLFIGFLAGLLTCSVISSKTNPKKVPPKSEKKTDH